MNIVLSFIGKLPSYIKESIYQIRLFYKDDIYLIINDLESPYISYLEKYDVKIIPYNNVINLNFINIVNSNIHKFLIVSNLTGREELFIRSFE